MDKILSFKPDKDEDFFAVLGCTEISTAEQIFTEYRIRVLECHPDKCPQDSKAAERFSLLTKAKEALTNPESRLKYLRWLHSGIAMSYKDWCVYRRNVHTSVHWAHRTPMPQILVDGHVLDPYSAKSEIMVETSGVDDNKLLICKDPAFTCCPVTSGHAIQHIKICSSNDDNTHNIELTSETGNDLLQKFRNYEI